MENFENKRVLIVDDTAFLRKALIKSLIGLGFKEINLTEADDGKVALDILKKTVKDPNKKIDLVLCDWNMPQMSGLELLKTVRASQSDYKKIPYILITTVSEKEKVIEALSYKVSGYLIKPINEEKLLENIERALGPEEDSDE